MIKNKKKIILLIFTFLISFTNISLVFANLGYSDNISAESYDPHPDDNNSNNNNGNAKVDPRCYNTPAKYQCSSTCMASGWVYRKTWEMKYSFYDVNDNIISKNILAGTSIGTSLYEERKAYWNYSGTVKRTCTKPEEKVTHIYYYDEIIKDEDGNIVRKRKIPYEVTYTVPADSYSCYSSSDSCKLAGCKDGYQKAINQLNSYNSSYTVNVPDANDAKCTGNNCTTKVYANAIIQNEVKNINSITSCDNLPNPVVKDYYYEKFGACLNLKTAQVRYLNNKNESCDTSKEILIENNTETSKRHWHVFIPLNFKSTDEFKISFTSNSIETDGKMCQQFIENYFKNYEYINYIKPLKGEFRKIKSYDKSLVSSGCKYESTIPIPVDQKFYHEETTKEKTTFKGFAFYYRPIDINNPFPNGIAKDSYWNGYNISQLKESFNKMTYYAMNIQTNKIREYNKNNSYASWDNMNLNGTSKFISSEGIILKSNNLKKPYNLGCGPLNSQKTLEDGSKNPLYHEWCGGKQ